MKNKLQFKYNMLQIMYWFMTCTVNGFTAIFLKSKGLSDAQIGIAAGTAAIFSIIVSPYLSALIAKIEKMTIKRMTLLVCITAAVIYICMTVLRLPSVLLILMYVVLFGIIMSLNSFLSVIFLDYKSTGIELDFGFARGIGSVAYAVAAVIIGPLCDLLNPDVITAAFILSGAGFIAALYSMPDCRKKTNGGNFEKEDVSIIEIVKKYKVFIIFLAAFSMGQGASLAIATYLIYFVERLGADTTVYGAAVFFMAASEMPVMAATRRLIKKYSCEKLLLAAVLFYILRNFTICLAGNIFVLILGMMMQGLSYGLFTAAITYYTAQRLEPRYTLMGQALITVFTVGVSSASGCFAGGMLMERAGLEGLSILVYCLTSVGAGLAVSGYIYYRKKEKKK